MTGGGISTPLIRTERCVLDLEAEVERLRALIAAMVPEYGLKYTEANGKVSYGVFANRAGAERTAAAISGRGWSTVKVEVCEHDVSPWRPVTPLDLSDTTG